MWDSFYLCSKNPNLPQFPPKNKITYFSFILFSHFRWENPDAEPIITGISFGDQFLANNQHTPIQSFPLFFLPPPPPSSYSLAKSKTVFFKRINSNLIKLFNFDLLCKIITFFVKMTVSFFFF